jgi:hypothetical protein
MITGRKTLPRPSRPNRAALTRRREPCFWIRTDADLTVISISGEIDASDIANLSPHARRLVRDCAVLIIDLTSNDSVNVDGLCALLALWSAKPATTERPRARELRIQFERLTVVLRSG